VEHSCPALCYSPDPGVSLLLFESPEIPNSKDGRVMPNCRGSYAAFARGAITCRHPKTTCCVRRPDGFKISYSEITRRSSRLLESCMASGIGLLQVPINTYLGVIHITYFIFLSISCPAWYFRIRFILATVRGILKQIFSRFRGVFDLPRSSDI
jgi:hypothetical protein